MVLCEFAKVIPYWWPAGHREVRMFRSAPNEYTESKKYIRIVFDLDSHCTGEQEKLTYEQNKLIIGIAQLTWRIETLPWILWQ